MADNNSSTSNGIGLGGVVFIIFLVLKLLEVAPVAAWSWWWVTSPIWISFAIVIGMAVLGAIAMGLIALFDRS